MYFVLNNLFFLIEDSDSSDKEISPSKSFKRRVLTSESSLISLDAKVSRKKSIKEPELGIKSKLLRSRISLTDAEFGDLDKMFFGQQDRDSSRNPTINSLNNHLSISKGKGLKAQGIIEEYKHKNGLDIGFRRKSCDCSCCGPLTSKEKDYMDLVC